MNQTAHNSRTAQLLRLLMFTVLFGSFIFAMTESVSTAQRLYLFAALVLFALLLVLGLRQGISEQRIYLILAFQTIIVTIVSLGVGLLNILYLLISLLAIMKLSPRKGLVVTGILILLNAGVHIYSDGITQNAFRDAIVNGIIIIIVAAFAIALLRADKAHAETQRVLEELQAAHDQLQEHAEQVEELAVAEERNRLSREVHDTLGHRLTVSIVQLEGAERLLDQQPKQAAVKIKTVRQQLDEGLSELRRTVALLRATGATDLALPKALKQLAEEFAEATNLRIQVTVPDSLPQLLDGHRLAIYRVAQEALTNIQRHAEANNASLTLQLSPETVTLEITDDGIGILSGAAENGFGLQGIHERATQLGGQVMVTTDSDRGTRLKFQLPRTNGESNG